MAAELTDDLGSDPAADAYVAAYLADGQMAQLASNHPSRIVRALARALVAATQGAEPVGFVHYHSTGLGSTVREAVLTPAGLELPDGAKLYTAPPPTAEVEKKAARYDWLRANYAPPSYGDGWDTMDNAIASGGAAMDQAIDAAIQSDQAQAGKGE